MELNKFQYGTIVYFLIRAPFVGLCINSLLETSKQDCWISVILGIVLGIIPFHIYQKNSTKNKWILFSILLFTIFYCSLIFWNLINFIKSEYLYETPKFIISIAFILPVFFILSKGIRTIGRVSTILFWISIFLVIISTLGLYNQCELNNIKPILEKGINPVLTGTFNYIGYCVLPLFFLSNIKKEKKYSLIFYILGSLTLFITMFIIIANYGIKMSLLFNYREFHVLKRISFAPFLERLEQFMFMQWIIDIFMFLVMGIYFISSNIKKNSNILSFVISVFILTLSIILFQNDILINNIIKYFPIASFLFLFIIPLIYYLCHYYYNKYNNNSCSYEE